MHNLLIIKEKLKNLKVKSKKRIDYYIPGIWSNSNDTIINVNPFDFYISKIDEILNLGRNKSKSVNSEKIKSVYNLFVRYATTFDHSNSDTLDTDDYYGFRKTGTFLKAISLLTYIASLGCDTIYLLPITSIGIDKKKGNLGSPYAIKNPYIIEPTLYEPILELDDDIEFKAFSEAIHLLDMKLICEFVFRTASVDADIALEHPEWFYWIKDRIKDRTNDINNENQYAQPIFTPDELKIIKEKVEAKDFVNLPEPHDSHKKMFTKAPLKVARVEKKIIGLINNNKIEVRIPNAFADWPPDDNQPLWSDVTYLKMYDHKDYNYIAYNTIRMYEKKLAKESNENRDLWEYITNIIPYYIQNFDIDGIMLDMGHSLPSKLRKQIVDKARQIKQDFIFWEENFNLSKSSKEDGYDAVVGFLPFDFHQALKIKNIISLFESNQIPIDFFATAENHNTPRAMARKKNPDFAKSTYLISKFLPTITFIHNGFELNESKPVNTGLDFSESEIKKYPPNELALFSLQRMNWLDKNNMIDFIHKINDLHKYYIDEKDYFNHNSIELIKTYNDDLLCFYIKTKFADKRLLFIINLSQRHYHYLFHNLNIESNRCILTNKTYYYQNKSLDVHFKAFEHIVMIHNEEINN